jgi:hypothetical protein
VSDGNIFVPKIINNGTGNVVIAAGSDLLAGNGGGGQVKTVQGNTISQTNTTPGNTYIYSGSAANTGLLSHLDSSFSELRLSGDMGTTSSPLAQNADSNVKYAVGTTIASGANAQVMFREKIALDTSTIKGATLDKTYGDNNTTSATGAALFAEMQAKLKQVNPGQIITRSLDGTNGAGEFKISKAALINDFSGSLNTDATSFSTSTHLTAKTHEYGALSSTKYSATLAAGEADVRVAKLALTGSIATPSNFTYGDTLVAGAVGLTNKVGADVVSANGVNINISGNTSTSGNLKAGSYTGIQSVTGLTGTDADNYTFANVKGDYKVDRKAISLSGITAGTKIYDGSTAAPVNATAATFNGMVSGDVLTVASTGTFGNKNVGTAKTVALSNTLGGTDLENYTVTDQTSTTGSITPRAATISATPTQLTFTGTTLNQAAPTTSNLVAGDDLTINGIASGQAEGTYRSALALTGDDAANYTFTLTDADLVITAKPFIPPVNPNGGNAGANLNGSRGTATLAPALDSGFQLASAEQGQGQGQNQGQCTQDTLSFCECEEAKDEEGLNIDGVQLCFEPQRGAELR